MNKKLFVIFTVLTFLFSAFTIYAEEKENNVVIITSGKENHQDLMSSKNIYIYVTFENTLLWKDTQTVDEYLQGRKSRGNKAKEDKEVMIKDFYKKIDGQIKFLGKKWNLKRIENPNDIKEGYIIYFNYDKCFPLPGLGAEGYGNIVVYKADKQSTKLMEGTVKSFSIAKSFADYDPTYQFSEVGQRFAKELVNFLKGKNVVFK